MSIASELSALNGYILGAYDEVTNKGGTVPQNKNMANLATAIASISTGGGGGQVVSCGHISSSVVAQVDVEHGLGQRPTIWGLLRESPFGQTMVRYEAIEKVRYYAQSGSSFVIRQADVFASRAGSFNQSYTQGAVVDLSVSTSYPDTNTSFNTNYYYTLPANNKYIGIDFRNTNQIDAFVKTNTNYFWFAIVATTTP